MVDSLQFLKKTPGGSGPFDAPLPNPLKELLARRPDIQHIKLNCANANITLPYIDLVNEILEEAIAPIEPLPIPGESASDAEHQAYEEWLARYQTREPEEGESQAEIERSLRAMPDPDHELIDAYKELKEAVHPWLLPFSLDQEKIRLFSQHLGVNIAEIRALFGREDNEVTQAFYNLATMSGCCSLAKVSAPG